MTRGSTNPRVARRTVLRGAAGAATAGLALGSTTPAAAQGAGEPDFGGWFDDVSNYDGTVDKTGQDAVTISVGATGNNGAFAFGPAAVRVDPGTTVTWEWTGEGGTHNVVDEAGSFESEMTDEAGYTFEHTFVGEGIVKYACEPHKAMGMKGAVVVGNPSGGAGSGGGQSAEPDYGGWFDDVENFDGTADETGADEVTITVGAEGNGGAFAFDPPAVRIDPGTTVVWEWSGNGGAHNVSAENGSFESKMTDEAGFTFEQTVESPGIVKYVCVPHEAMGMKGALVVGDPGSGGGSSAGSSSGLADTLAVGGGLGLAGSLFAMFALGLRGKTRDRGQGR